MVNSIVTFGPVDERALAQLRRCAEKAEAAVLAADHHVGYSQPIGGIVAYRGYISPSGVGYDIACGNKAVKTNIRAKDVVGAGTWRLSQGAAGETPSETATDTSQGREATPEGELKNEAPTRAYSKPRPENALPRIMDEIVRRISFGVGRINDEPADHPVLAAIRDADFQPQRQLSDLASRQLGTVGSGNHYVDLLEDEGGWLWIGVHFGSRGFGHKTATGFLALSQGRCFEDKAGDGGMDSPPVLFDTASELGQSYIAAMQLAGRYAYAGRDLVCAKVLEILGAEAVDEVHNHHNFAWLEDGLWVVRKGATPAFPGQRGFVGGSMGDVSVILEGIESEQAKSALHSTVHGAGRVLSRTQAAGKYRKRTVERTAPDGTTYVKKIRERDPSTGLIDWPAVQAEMREKGIELRGAGADEAPGVYKNLSEVLAYHAESARVLHTLAPLGVAMAGANTYDPYQD